MGTVPRGNGIQSRESELAIYQTPIKEKKQQINKKHPQYNLIFSLIGQILPRVQFLTPINFRKDRCSRGVMNRPPYFVIFPGTGTHLTKASIYSCDGYRPLWTRLLNPVPHTETGPDVPQQWLRHGALRDQQQHCRRRITVGTSEPASCALNPMHYCLSKLGSKACYHKNKHLSTANSGGFLWLSWLQWGKIRNSEF